ncbi:MAG TPA: beta-N-acetylhexosaminidase [Bacteroidales bacterium]|nr:beta-N-acetylhexosaminidase [Bacteroidales bacterium]
MSNRRKNPAFKAFFSIIMIALMISCKPKTVSDLTEVPVIPKPVSVSGTGDWFVLGEKTVISYPEGNEEVHRIARYLGERLKPATGYTLELEPTQAAKNVSIYLELLSDGSTGDEGYNLDITPELLRLSASSPAGLFRAVQTVMQLFPASIEEKTMQEGPWQVPTGTISDRPDYAYRGMMLDVARHFFTVDEVKKLIDQISNYKINFLHLHLSDDQGWRIEIKSWPKLTEVGGKTEVGGGEGGFYTQEQYTELVNYAAERYITIVPEIDMPGHTNAALASYPELNCNGKATEIYTGTKVGFSSFCTNKEITYKFIDDVVREISAITPGPYFHMGGDESHSTKKEDYIPFVNRVQEIIASHGKQVIGWDDIAIATLKPNTIAQHWANVKNANMAVAQGAKILMSPAIKAYMDMQYDSTSKFGLHWASYIEVDSAYIWDPASFTPGIEKQNIVGIEAPLWAETISNSDELEYLVFPRLPGYAEIGWTAPSQRNWDEYKNRLSAHAKRFRQWGIDFYESKKVDWNQAEAK